MIDQWKIIILVLRQNTQDNQPRMESTVFFQRWSF